MRQAFDQIGISARGKGLYALTPQARAGLTQIHLAIPVSDGTPMSGTWQGIYVFEHRRGVRTRSVALHLPGE